MKRPPIFIVGSPRSGTTILGDVLDRHPELAQWYEPYFVTERFSGKTSHDGLSEQDVTPQKARYIRRQFDKFHRRSGFKAVIDKSPRNSFRIPFLLSVFPEGRIIHIVRDGRDTVLSMRNRWAKREAFLKKGHPGPLFEAVRKYFSHQPLLHHKFLFLWQEWKRVFAWEGRSGWGERFPGWKEVFDDCTKLEFCAYQWIACVNAVHQASEAVPNSQYIELRYENLLDSPQQKLQELFSFLEVQCPPNLDDLTRDLMKGNYGKWKHAFTDDELAQLGRIMQPLLQNLGYTQDESWFLQS